MTKKPPRKTQVQRRAAIDTAREALPSPKPATAAKRPRVFLRKRGETEFKEAPPGNDNAAYEIWHDLLGLPDRPDEPLPLTAGEAEIQKVSPHERLRLANKSYLDAVARSAGKLEGDTSKQTRIDYATVILEFKRGGVPHMLVAKTLKEKEIADTLALLPIPKGALRRVKPEAFIKFLRREQAWVREQLVLA